MRRAAKVDNNQKDLVSKLRKMGMSVAVISTLGEGFPDIMVGFAGLNFLFEIKNPKQKPSGRRLTDLENIWHQTWVGQVDRIETLDDAIGVIARGTGRSELLSLLAGLGG